MPRKGTFWGLPGPPPDDEPDPLAPYPHEVASFFAGFTNWLRSQSLDAELDTYLEHHPRPDEPHDPALD